MIRERINQGQLAFLPSDALLIQCSANGAVSTWRKLKEPRTLLVLNKEKDSPYFKILYDGESWLARSQDLYPV
jgi:hypothetical protein